MPIMQMTFVCNLSISYIKPFANISSMQREICQFYVSHKFKARIRLVIWDSSE